MKRYVEIIIGSDSDREAMNGCIQWLNLIGIDWELSILSAHRHKDDLADRIRELIEEGVSVIICAAGWSAALPGDVAAQIRGQGILVIGVALPSAEFPDAMDALLAICRVPPGIPLVCAGIGAGGGRNAALVAGEFLVATEVLKQETLTAAYQEMADKKPAQPGCENSEGKSA